jgi:hypothetical protein
MVTKGSGVIRKFSTAIAVFALLVLCSLVSFTPANAGKTVYSTLKLNQQDWLGKIVSDGAKGQLKFIPAGPTFQFAFGATGLDPETGYSLLRSRAPEVVLDSRFDVIGSGTSDAVGNLSIKDSYNFNMTIIAAKIILIPTNQLIKKEDGSWALQATGYPDKYLFSQDSISYVYTNSALKGGDIQRPQVSSFDDLGPQVGDKAVDFTLLGIDPAEKLKAGNLSQPLKTYRLNDLLETKPVVLVFGAFT